MSLLRLTVLAALVAATATPVAADPLPWRRSITEPDRKRLAGVWKAWAAARSQVEIAGHLPEWTALGDLLDPAAGTPGDPPAPGSYRCRTVKLGTRNPGMPVFVQVPPTPCRVEIEGEFLRFVDGGAQRTAGLLYPDGERMVYLGAVTLSSETGRYPYNRASERNQVGVLHRLGPGRWRLELPTPLWESLLDVIEIRAL